MKQENMNVPVEVEDLVEVIVSVKGAPSNWSAITKTIPVLCKFLDESDLVLRRVEIPNIGVSGFPFSFTILRAVYENDKDKVLEGCKAFVSEYFNIPVVLISSFNYDYNKLSSLKLFEKELFNLETNFKKEEGLDTFAQIKERKFSI